MEEWEEEMDSRTVAKRNGDEGRMEGTVTFAYFKSVQDISVPQETQNFHWSIFLTVAVNHAFH